MCIYFNMKLFFICHQVDDAPGRYSDLDNTGERGRISFDTRIGEGAARSAGGAGPIDIYLSGKIPVVRAAGKSIPLVLATRCEVPEINHQHLSGESRGHDK